MKAALAMLARLALAPAVMVAAMSAALPAYGAARIQYTKPSERRQQ